MRIGQLKDYLEALIAAGFDPNTPVCIHEEVPAISAIEVSDVALLNGHFREDPSPKLGGFRSVNGSFLLLKSSLDYAPMLDAFPVNYSEIETGVDIPAKSWPAGNSLKL
jgi:hypothetical protein